MFLLNNAFKLRLSQRVDKRRGGSFISEFIELLNASWDEGEILRGRVPRKAPVITFSFEPAFVPSCTRLYCGAGCGGKMLLVKSQTVA